MDLNKIIEIQKAFDSKHGWTPKSSQIEEIVDYINKDIVGLVGELGEFSNQIKKINLVIDSNRSGEKIYYDKLENLSEEIVDTFIYIIRIASHLNLNLEEEYLKKLHSNELRFMGFDINEQR
ncbi:hypothetical protein [Clostridium sp. YIM B02506]|jgi:NTP pyrophosphatase (non-canonical NTP hydrolase)|uniref:hypothetical protein n=1 Tax=Clostridium sp. YIM B02506 TaxID=2910680 RepID=UPI001EEEAD00|nr:hypothetical protein [Clostridium sp. YIM B02506]